MKKSLRHIIAFILIFMIILGAGIAVKRMKDGFLSEGQGYEWSKLLDDKETIIDWTVEGSTAYLLISSEGRTDYGDYLTILRIDQGEWRRVYDNDFEELKPWKIKLGDIDGDERSEIMVGVYKTAHYDEAYKNRMFIFNYENDILTKKWTGSQFAGEWNDFYTYDLLDITGDELIFIEELEKGLEKVSIYYWFDFGFLKLAESEGYPDIRDLDVIGENCIRINYGKKGRKTAVLTVRAGGITELEAGS